MSRSGGRCASTISPEVAALEARIHIAPWTMGNFRDALAAGYSSRVGERDFRIIAYGVLMISPGEAQILNLSVVPEARREGIGRALLRHFIDDARIFASIRSSSKSAPRTSRRSGCTSPRDSLRSRAASATIRGRHR
jgi:GNAT superfamily N-acetyltransferase